MGGTTWSSSAYQASAQTKQSQTRQQVMNNDLSPEMDPKNIKLREARDSAAHPESVPIIVALDITGSMGEVPEQLIKGKLKDVMDTCIAHGIEHPQIMFLAVGDHYTDSAPFQISQFESGNIELEKWLSLIYPEGGGGGNGGESYALSWFFAGFHTSTDHFEKRGKKGFLFTIGDEDVHPIIQAKAFQTIFGSGESDLRAEDLLTTAQRMYNVFHINIDHGYRLSHLKDLLGERLLTINDPDVVAELIGSTVAVVNGADITKVTSGFDAATANKVTMALASVKSDVATVSNSRTTAL